MQIRKLTSLLAIAAICSCSTTSCSDDDDNSWSDEGSKVELPKTRMFILNEGMWNQNNAGIAFYAPNDDAQMIDDIFYRQNGIRLGDNGQALIEYDDALYVSVSGSKYIAKLNAAGVEEARVSFANDPDLKGGNRYLAADDGYVYVSFYGGWVAKFKASDLSLVAKVQTGGANLEGLTIEDDVLYVANSYEQTSDPTTGYSNFIYKTEVYTIDLRSFTQGKTVTVNQNPNQLTEAGDKVFLISWDYSEPSYVLQLIDPKAGNSVKKLGYATNMAADDERDILYLVDSRTDYSVYPYATTNTFSSYDVRTGTLSQTSPLKNAPAELSTASVYSMAVDDRTGELYVMTTNYAASNGDVYRFDRSGNFVERFDCGGQGPKAAVFMHL